MAKSKSSRSSKSNTVSSTTTNNDPLLGVMARKARELGLNIDITDETVSKVLDAHKRKQVATVLTLSDPNAHKIRKEQMLQKLREASDSDVLLARANARIKETIARGTALAGLSETENMRYEAARELLRGPRKAAAAASTVQPEVAAAIPTEGTEGTNSVN